MIKLTDILNESYNPNVYQIECRVVMGAGNRPIQDIISDIRAIPGITVVDTIESDYNTDEGRHVTDLSIKVDPSPFNPFDRSSYIKILNDIKKLPDVRGAKFISSPVVTENTLQRLIKEVLSKKKEKRDRCLRIADRKYDKPSAYKSGAVVRCRKGEIWKDLKEEEHKLYAKKKFEAELIEGKVGYLYHSTNIIAALNIIKQNQINPANITLKQYIGTDNPPWWYSDEFGEPQPLYGDFIYASSKEKGNYYGVSNPEITFVIDGDKVKNSGIDIYKAPETMEEGVCLIQGPVDLKFIKQIVINEDLINKEDKLSIMLLLRKNNIKYIVKETDDPQSGKSAPYGSGYAKVKEAIQKILKEEKKLNIQDLAYKQIPGLLEKGIKNELKFLSNKMNMSFEDTKNATKPQIKRVPLSSIKPSQYDEDYENPSSKYEVEEFEKILNGEKDIKNHRAEDFNPILVDKNTNKIVDGNHRHYAFSTIGSPYAVVLFVDIPKEYLNEAKKESLHKWFKRSGPKGKEGGWVDCNAPDGKGGYKACGRKEGEKRAKYPSCRPTPSKCKSPGKGKKWGKTK